jgi:hypothetical protein
MIGLDQNLIYRYRKMHNITFNLIKILTYKYLHDTN